MTSNPHWSIFLNDQSEKTALIQTLIEGPQPEPFQFLKNKKGALFSKQVLDHYIEEEVRHDNKALTSDTPQSLQSMSSGERKKALLSFILAQKPEYIILDNPFDNLDREFQEELKNSLSRMAEKTVVIQLVSRAGDLLPFIHNYALPKGSGLHVYPELQTLLVDWMDGRKVADIPIPAPLPSTWVITNPLVALRNVSVSFSGKPVLNGISWTIRPGEFWQLAGPNGSGKSTLLSMITGDSPKGYGQDIVLFGNRKGSGESIWDIKKNLGYYTPAMTDRFRGFHTVEHMLVSGLTDSVGLYVHPTESQLRIAREWLAVIGMEGRGHHNFQELETGLQRLVMCARAMIKHPPLLILDEPTAGLDDASAAQFVSLVNKISKESSTAIVFVSHREEPGLHPGALFRLRMTESGSIGEVEA